MKKAAKAKSKSVKVKDLKARKSPKGGVRKAGGKQEVY